MKCMKSKGVFFRIYPLGREVGTKPTILNYTSFRQALVSESSWNMPTAWEVSDEISFWGLLKMFLGYVTFREGNLKVITIWAMKKKGPLNPGSSPVPKKAKGNEICLSDKKGIL